MLLTRVPADAVRRDAGVGPAPEALSRRETDEADCADDKAKTPSFERRGPLRYRHFPRLADLPPTLPFVWRRAEALVGLADALAALGSYDTARRRLEDARAAFPLAHEPLRRLALLAQRVGAHDEACRHWNLYVRRFAGMLSVQDRADYLRCLAYAKGGAYVIISIADRAPMDAPAVRDALAAVARHRRWRSVAALLGAGDAATCAEVTRGPASDFEGEGSNTPQPGIHPDIGLLPDGWDVVAGLADRAIHAGQTEEAQALVRAMPSALLGHRVVSELFAWLEAAADRLPEANRLLSAWHDRHYWPSFDCTMESFLRIDSRRIVAGPESICAVVVAQGGSHDFGDFLAHHRAIGVERFVFIDNGLAAEDRAFLGSQPDCHLFWTEDSAESAGGGMRWVNHVMRNHLPDGWALVLRPDQRLHLPPEGPGMLAAFANQARKFGFEAVLGGEGPDAEVALLPDEPPSYWMRCSAPSPAATTALGPVVMVKARTARFLGPGAILPMRLATTRLGLSRAAARG